MTTTQKANKSKSTPVMVATVDYDDMEVFCARWHRLLKTAQNYMVKKEGDIDLFTRHSFMGVYHANGLSVNVNCSTMHYYSNGTSIPYCPFSLTVNDVVYTIDHSTGIAYYRYNNAHSEFELYSHDEFCTEFWELVNDYDFYNSD